MEKLLKLTVRYEWDIETLDEHGDIEDHFHSDKCPKQPLTVKQKLVLVRDVGNDEKGVVTRSWAYVADGILPDYFENAAQIQTHNKVPKRFHEEFARARPEGVV